MIRKAQRVKNLYNDITEVNYVFTIIVSALCTI